MAIKRKAQSTAEYAIVIALVVSVSAGVMSTALRGGMRQNQDQALSYMIQQGDLSAHVAGDVDRELYTQTFQDTTIDSGSFVDRSVLRRGGSREAQRSSTADTRSIEVETLNRIDSN